MANCGVEDKEGQIQREQLKHQHKTNLKCKNRKKSRKKKEEKHEDKEETREVVPAAEATKAQGWTIMKCKNRKKSKKQKRKCLPAAERALCPWQPPLCCSPPAGSPNALTPSGGCSSLRSPHSALGAFPRRPALSPEHCLMRACLLQDHLRPLHARGQSHVCSNTFCMLVEPPLWVFLSPFVISLSLCNFSVP